MGSFISFFFFLFGSTHRYTPSLASIPLHSE
jgi:hypothetical protein